MPRCMINTSPDDRSASRYLARRPMPVTVTPSRRLAKSFGNGQRRSPRCTSTLAKRAPSIAGSSPRRTVSTSGSSGIFLHGLAEGDAVGEWVDDRHLQHAPLLLIQTRAVMPIFLVVQFAVQVPHAIGDDIGVGARRTVAVMFAEMNDERAAQNLHVDRQVGLKLTLPIDLAAQKIDIEFAGFFQGENAENRNGALKFDCHAILPLTLAPRPL